MKIWLRASVLAVLVFSLQPFALFGQGPGVVHYPGGLGETGGAPTVDGSSTVSNLVMTTQAAILLTNASVGNGTYQLKTLTPVPVFTNGIYTIVKSDDTGNDGLIWILTNGTTQLLGFNDTPIGYPPNFDFHGLPIGSNWVALPGLTTDPGSSSATTGTVSYVVATNLSFAAGGPDYIGLVQSTRLSGTFANGAKVTINPLLFLGAGNEGMLRSIEFNSHQSDYMSSRTNRTLRVYVDGGDFPTTNNLLAEFPLGNLMCAKYFDRFATNFRTAYMANTRYLSWIETTTNASQFNATNSFVGAHYSLNLQYPMPFTNGILVQIWNTPSNAPFVAGYAWANYELGTLPPVLKNLRLRTYRTNLTTTNTAATNIVVLDSTAPGEVVSIFCSDYNAGGGSGYFEGRWGGFMDYYPRIDFGCAGGEDMFHNGYFFDASYQDQTANAAANSVKTNKTTIGYDFGTRYVNIIPGSDHIVEAYRHFTVTDAHRWLNKAHVQFEVPSGFSGLKWDTVVVYYSN